jgi:hypothetical protein
VPVYITVFWVVTQSVLWGVINISEEPDVTTLIVKCRDIKPFQYASISINKTTQPTKPELK